MPLEQWMRIARVATEPGICGQVLIAIKIESAAVKGIAAGTRDDVDRAVGRKTGRLVEVDGRELELLNDLLGNLKAGANRPDGVDVRAVDRHAGVPDTWVGLKAGAESCDEHAIVRAADRTAHTRLQPDQIEEIPTVERQAFNLRPSDDAADLMVVVADHWTRGAHRHRVAHFTNLQREVDRCRCSRLDDRVAFDTPETRGFGRYSVIRGRQGRCAVRACCRRRDGSDLFSVEIRDADLRACDSPARRVGHDARDRAIRRLRGCHCHRHEQQQHDCCANLGHGCIPPMVDSDSRRTDVNLGFAV
jgi:hypothetical protein